MMMRKRKILAPTDFSDASRDGVQYALEMAEDQGAEVIVFHVDDYIPSPYWLKNSAETVEKFIEDRKRDLGSFLEENFSHLLTKLEIRKEADIGIVHEKIVEKAAKENVELIVLATHGRTGFEHAFLGSVAEQVVRRATCPVLSIPPKSRP